MLVSKAEGKRIKRISQRERGQRPAAVQTIVLEDDTRLCLKVDLDGPYGPEVVIDVLPPYDWRKAHRETFPDEPLD